MRGAHRTRRVDVTEPPQHRHGLRRRERQVEARDPVLAELAHREPANRVPAAQHQAQRVGVDGAGQAEVRGRAPGPLPRGLTAARLVVLSTIRNCVEVVTLLSRSQLADAQHVPVTVSGIEDASVCKIRSQLSRQGTEEVQGAVVAPARSWTS